MSGRRGDCKLFVWYCLLFQFSLEVQLLQNDEEGRLNQSNGDDSCSFFYIF